jgi:dTDP-4-amino-4,6-dideoxygalactose transaminase
VKSLDESSEVPLLDLVRQYHEIRDEIDEAVFRVLEASSFIGGREVRGFEEAYAEFVGVPYCIGVGNGTDAIEIMLEASGLPAGGEVIVPANSFIATSEAVSRSGLRVVFADVREDTYTLDPIDVETRITPRTVAVMAVHLYGHPACMAELASLASRHGFKLFEDAAQAHGASIRGKIVGSLGLGGTFSFYPGKNLGAYGDAGAVTTSDPELGQRIRMLANHGRTTKYAHQFEGRNSRLDALQAAVLLVKLRHLDEWTEKRRSLALRYSEGLQGVGDLMLPGELPGYRHVYHLYVVRSAARDGLRHFLDSKGIRSGVHYPTALPQLDAYRQHPQHGEALRASVLSQQVLSLPMGDGLDVVQVDRVIEAVRAYFG